MNTESNKFNYLILLLAISLVISVFARFSGNLGIQSALFFLLSIAFFFNFNTYFAGFKNYVLPILLFILAAVFSYYTADFQYNARNGIMMISYCGAACLLTVFLKPYDKRSVLLIPVLIGLWLTIFLFAANVTFSDYLAPQVLSRSARATAGFLILALCLSFVFWWTERKIYMYTSFILLTAVILTKVYFAVGLACLAFGVFLYVMKDKVKLKTTVAVLPFLALAAAAFFQVIKSGYFAPKIVSWQTALSVIKDNIITGTGFGNYSTVSGAYATIAGFDVSLPDNLFLHVLAETGIAGFVFFAAVLAVFFVLTAKKLKNKENKVIYFPVLLAVIFFIAYNIFESTVFVSTNMLLFFMLLAFPYDHCAVKRRAKKINSYISILLILPLIYVLALPLLALEDYKRGLMFFSANKYLSARDEYLNALNKDGLNPAYASKLSDTYFAMSRNEEGSVNLDKAIEYKKLASALNRHEGKYYYDLAWLYKLKGEKELASENIIKALEMEPFDRHSLEAYGELIY